MFNRPATMLDWFSSKKNNVGLVHMHVVTGEAAIQWVFSLSTCSTSIRK